MASLLGLLRDDPELTLDLTHRLTRQDTTDGFLLRFGFVSQVDLETAEACLSTSNFSLIETEDEEWASTAVRERVWLALFYVTNEALALQCGPVRWAVAA